MDMILFVFITGSPFNFVSEGHAGGFIMVALPLGRHNPMLYCTRVNDGSFQVPSRASAFGQ
jgi:hypothetical protein